MIFNLAQGMVVSVRWCPGDEHKLVSCSYDGTLKLWDTRGRLPLHTVSAHEGERAMGCDFHGPKRIISGGEDILIFVWAIRLTACFVYRH